ILSSMEPDGSLTQFAYDANSNQTALMTPLTIAHDFDFDLLDLFSVYRAPAIGNDNAYITKFSYNGDKKISSQERPDGQIVSYQYEAAKGRILSIGSDNTTEQYAYVKDSPYISQVSTGDGINIQFAYAGSLVLDKLYSGEVNGDLASTYSNNGALLA